MGLMLRDPESKMGLMLQIPMGLMLQIPSSISTPTTYGTVRSKILEQSSSSSMSLKIFHEESILNEDF